jgi:hypothetical protein
LSEMLLLGKYQVVLVCIRIVLEQQLYGTIPSFLDSTFDFLLLWIRFKRD